MNLSSDSVIRLKNPEKSISPWSWILCLSKWCANDNLLTIICGIICPFGYLYFLVVKKWTRDKLLCKHLTKGVIHWSVECSAPNKSEWDWDWMKQMGLKWPIQIILNWLNPIGRAAVYQERIHTSLFQKWDLISSNSIWMNWTSFLSFGLCFHELKSLLNVRNYVSGIYCWLF